MKKSLFLFNGIFLFSFVMLAHPDPQIPDAVKKSFATQFPTVKKVKWEMEAESIFEASFKHQGREMSAEFKADGQWISKETEIKKNELPEAIRKSVLVKYPGFKMEDPEKIEFPNGDIHFEIELEKGKKEMELLFDSEGNVLKEAEEAPDKDK